MGKRIADTKTFNELRRSRFMLIALIAVVLKFILKSNIIIILVVVCFEV